MTRTALLAYRASIDEDAALYHFHDPELIPVGLLLKLRGKRVIFDVHEDAAKDVHDKGYLPAWSKPFVRFGVQTVFRTGAAFFDGLVAATAGILRGLPPKKSVLVRNVPILADLPSSSDAPFAQRPRNVVYIGGLAPLNGVEQMVRAYDRIPAAAGIGFIMGGKFDSPDTEHRVSALPGMRRVTFLGWVDRERVPGLLADARAGLVLYQPSPNVLGAEPNKFFEVMAAGLPLIASDLPHWREFIELHGCGVVVPPGDTDAIAAAIRKLIDEPSVAEAMGRRGRELVRTSYNWEREKATLLSLYERVLGERSPAAAAPAQA
jgi:glycosyltransferase involved in cell wall biosynthesis